MAKAARIGGAESDLIIIIEGYDGAQP